MPEPQPNARLLEILRIYCRGSAILVAAIGCLVLVGWAFHIEMLKSILPGLVTMKANTAFCLTLCAASLWLLLPSPSPALWRRSGRLLALVAVLISFATGFEYIFGLNLGIDQLLFREA